MDSILLGFTVCLALSFLLSELFQRLRYPRVIGQILAGILLGLPFIKDGLIGPDGVSFIASLADIGVVFLMLLVGTEIKVHELKKASKKAATLAVLGYAIPLSVGFLVMKVLGFDTLVSTITAICLAISAEAVTIDILVEYGILNTSLGTTMMEAGMIDDLLGVFSLAAVIAVLQGGGIGSLQTMPGEFASFIIIAYLLGIIILPRAAKAVWKEKSEAAVFSLAIIFGLIIVLLSEYFKLSSVVGAFVAGIIIQLDIKNRKEEKEVVESLNIVTFGLVVPFFFIYTGMNLDLNLVFEGKYLIILLTVIALAGKMVGAQIMGAIFHIKPADRRLLGWGMNPRGAVELIIVNIALAKNLISLEIYSAVVTMALLSAIISPIMFRRTLDSGECSLKVEDATHHNHHVHVSEKPQ